MKARKRKSRVTIKTVADDAGVSCATVSLILREAPGRIEQFRPDTVSRVRTSAEKLGYRRNLFASGMPSGHSAFLAVVLKDGHEAGTDWQHWTVQGAIWEGINTAAHRHGVHTIVLNTPADAGPTTTDRLASLIDGGVSGAIFYNPSPSEEELIHSRLDHEQSAVVLFPRQVGDWPTNAIDVDNVAIGRIAGELLVAQKRRHWLVVRNEQITDACRQRWEGFTQLAREAGVRLGTINLPAVDDECGAAQLILPYLQRASSAGLFALDSMCSRAAAAACLRAGLTPGRDCPIVGCQVAPWKVPGVVHLTSIETPWRQAGILGVEHLSRARAGDKHKRLLRTVLLRPQVVEGSSCPVPTGFSSGRRSHRQEDRLPAVACS
jgi:LacI family transcriptional regulator